MSYRSITLIWILLLASTAISLAQSSGNLFDTVYYDQYHAKVKAKYGYMYREPCIKEGNHYTTVWRTMDGTPLYTCSYIPAVIDYHYSIEEGVGYKDGPIIIYDSTYIICTGQYKDDKAIGLWTLYRKGGEKIRATHLYDSSGKRYHEINYNLSGKKMFEGDYADLRKPLIADNKRTKRLGSYVPDGPFIYYFRDTQKVAKVLNYSGGMLHGSCAYFDEKTFKKTVKGNFKSDERDGIWQYFDAETGNLLETCVYEDGYLQGPDTNYHVPTGKIKAHGSFKNGYKTGEWKFFFDGTDQYQAEISYRKDDGTAVFYDSASREIIFEGRVNDAGKQGEWKRYYASNRKLKSTETYKDNVLHGPMKEYDTSGYLSGTGEFTEGKRSGTWNLNYDFSDDLWVTSHWDNDTMNGAYTIFYRNGKVKRQAEIGKGKMLASTCYTLVGEEEPCAPLATDATFREDIMTYIGNNLRYPEDAKDAGIEGKVEISFAIDEVGDVVDVNIVRGIDMNCDQEAKRLIEQMPKWTPMQVDGKTFKTYKTVPVVFWIPESEKKKKG